jgi:hypothetical protein
MDTPQQRLVTLTRVRLFGLLALTAAVGALVGGVLVYRFLVARADEPPIRVKNGGSMEFRACNGQGWDGDAASWMPTQEHSANRLRVTIAATSGPCQNQTYVGTQVVFRYSNDTSTDRITVQAGSRTKLMPRNALTQPGTDPNTLHYSAGSDDANYYISQVVVKGGGTPNTCDFTSRDQLTYVDVCSASGCKTTCP